MTNSYRIVPIQRIRRESQGYTYSYNGILSIGSLVLIPWRNTKILGVVWEKENPSNDKMALKSIEKIYFDGLLNRDNLRQVEWLAEYGLCSLSTALYIYMPVLLRKYPVSVKVEAFLRTQMQIVRPQNKSGVTINETCVTINKSEAIKQKLILSPYYKKEYNQKLREVYKDKLIDTFEFKNDFEDLSDWFRVRNETNLVVIGKDRAINMPWQTLDNVQIINPFDITYYRNNTPYISLVKYSQFLASNYRGTWINLDSFPKNISNEIWQNNNPTNLINNDRQIYSNDTPQFIETYQVKYGEYFNKYLVSKITEGLKQKNKVFILINAKDRLSESKENGLENYKLIPGLETIRKQIIQAVGNEEYLIFGTHKSLTELNLKIFDYFVWYNFDIVANSNNYLNTLNYLADLYQIINQNKPILLQGSDNDGIFWQSLNTDKPEINLNQKIVLWLDDLKNNNQPPYRSFLSLMHPEEKDALEIYNKLSKKIDELNNIKIGYPFITTYKKKSYWTIIIDINLDNSRLPVKIRSFLVSLPRPWRIMRDAWFIF